MDPEKVKVRHLFLPTISKAASSESIRMMSSSKSPSPKKKRLFSASEEYLGPSRRRPPASRSSSDEPISDDFKRSSTSEKLTGSSTSEWYNEYKVQSFGNSSTAAGNRYFDEDEARRSRQKYDQHLASIRDEQERVQRKTFINWLNSYLSKCIPPLVVRNLTSDLQDGTKLLALLQILSGEQLPVEKGKALKRVHFLSNIETALQFLRNKGIKLVNINTSDVADGRPLVVLGLIWIIILHFQLRRKGGTIPLSLIEGCSRDSDNSDRTLHSVESIGTISKSKFSSGGRNLVLNWVSATLPFDCGLKIHDFGSSWRDGYAFLHIVNSLLRQNNLVPIDLEAVSSQTNQERLELAFELASKHLGIIKLLDSEDVDVPKPDERSIMTYIAQFLHKYPIAKQIPITTSSNSVPDEFNELNAWLRTKIHYLERLEETTQLPQDYYEYKMFRNQIDAKEPIFVALKDTLMQSKSLPIKELCYDLNTLWSKLQELMITWLRFLDSLLPKEYDFLIEWLRKNEQEHDLLQQPIELIDQESTGTVGKALEQHKEFVLDLERVEKRFSNLYGSNICREQVPSTQLENLAARLNSIKVVSHRRLAKLKFLEHKICLTTVLRLVDNKLRLWRGKFGDHENVIQLLKEYENFIGKCNVFQGFIKELIEMEIAAEAYKQTSDIEPEEIEYIDNYVRESSNHWRELALEIHTIKYDLEHLNNQWNQWDCLHLEFCNWLSYVESQIPVNDDIQNTNLAQNLNIWRIKHRQLEDLFIFLVSRCKKRIANQIKTDYNNLTERWRKLNEILVLKTNNNNHMKYDLQNQKGFRLELDTLTQNLKEAKKSIDQTTFTSLDELNREISTLIEFQANLDDNEMAFKRVSKALQLFLPQIARTDLDEIMSQMKEEKDDLSLLSKTIPQRIHKLQQISTQLESLKTSTDEVLTWLQKAEFVLSTNSIECTELEMLQYQLNQHQNFFVHTVYYKTLLDSQIQLSSSVLDSEDLKGIDAIQQFDFVREKFTGIAQEARFWEERFRVLISLWQDFYSTTDEIQTALNRLQFLMQEDYFVTEDLIRERTNLCQSYNKNAVTDLKAKSIVLCENLPQWMHLGIEQKVEQIEDFEKRVLTEVPTYLQHLEFHSNYTLFCNLLKEVENELQIEREIIFRNESDSIGEALARHRNFFTVSNNPFKNCQIAMKKLEKCLDKSTNKQFLKLYNDLVPFWQDICTKMEHFEDELQNLYESWCRYFQSFVEMQEFLNSMENDLKRTYNNESEKQNVLNMNLEKIVHPQNDNLRNLFAEYKSVIEFLDPNTRLREEKNFNNILNRYRNVIITYELQSLRSDILEKSSMVQEQITQMSNNIRKFADNDLTLNIGQESVTELKPVVISDITKEEPANSTYDPETPQFESTLEITFQIEKDVESKNQQELAESAEIDEMFSKEAHLNLEPIQQSDLIEISDLQSAFEPKQSIEIEKTYSTEEQLNLEPIQQSDLIQIKEDPLKGLEENISTELIDMKSTEIPMISKDFDIVELFVDDSKPSDFKSDIEQDVLKSELDNQELVIDDNFDANKLIDLGQNVEPSESQGTIQLTSPEQEKFNPQVEFKDLFEEVPLLTPKNEQTELKNTKYLGKDVEKPLLEDEPNSTLSPIEDSTSNETEILQFEMEDNKKYSNEFNLGQPEVKFNVKLDLQMSASVKDGKMKVTPIPKDRMKKKRKDHRISESKSDIENESFIKTQDFVKNQETSTSELNPKDLLQGRSSADIFYPEWALKPQNLSSNLDQIPSNLKVKDEATSISSPLIEELPESKKIVPPVELKDIGIVTSLIESPKRKNKSKKQKEKGTNKEENVDDKSTYVFEVESSEPHLNLELDSSTTLIKEEMLSVPEVSTPKILEEHDPRKEVSLKEDLNIVDQQKHSPKKHKKSKSKKFKLIPTEISALRDETKKDTTIEFTPEESSKLSEIFEDFAASKPIEISEFKTDEETRKFADVATSISKSDQSTELTSEEGQILPEESKLIDLDLIPKELSTSESRTFEVVDAATSISYITGDIKKIGSELPNLQVDIKSTKAPESSENITGTIPTTEDDTTQDQEKIEDLEFDQECLKSDLIPQHEVQDVGTVTSFTYPDSSVTDEEQIYSKEEPISVPDGRICDILQSIKDDLSASKSIENIQSKLYSKELENIPETGAELGPVSIVEEKYDLKSEEEIVPIVEVDLLEKSLLPEMKKDREESPISTEFVPHSKDSDSPISWQKIKSTKKSKKQKRKEIGEPLHSEIEVVPIESNVEKIQNIESLEQTTKSESQDVPLNFSSLKKLKKQKHKTIVRETPEKIIPQIESVPIVSDLKEIVISNVKSIEMPSKDSIDSEAQNLSANLMSPKKSKRSKKSKKHKKSKDEPDTSYIEPIEPIKQDDTSSKLNTEDSIKLEMKEEEVRPIFVDKIPSGKSKKKSKSEGKSAEKDIEIISIDQPPKQDTIVEQSEFEIKRIVDSDVDIDKSEDFENSMDKQVKSKVEISVENYEHALTDETEEKDKLIDSKDEMGQVDTIDFNLPMEEVPIESLNANVGPKDTPFTKSKDTRKVKKSKRKNKEIIEVSKSTETSPIDEKTELFESIPQIEQYEKDKVPKSSDDVEQEIEPIFYAPETGQLQLEEVDKKIGKSQEDNVKDKGTQSSPKRSKKNKKVKQIESNKQSEIILTEILSLPNIKEELKEEEVSIIIPETKIDHVKEPSKEPESPKKNKKKNKSKRKHKVSESSKSSYDEEKPILDLELDLELEKDEIIQVSTEPLPDSDINLSEKIVLDSIGFEAQVASKISPEIHDLNIETQEICTKEDVESNKINGQKRSSKSKSKEKKRLEKLESLEIINIPYTDQKVVISGQPIHSLELENYELKSSEGEIKFEDASKALKDITLDENSGLEKSSTIENIKPLIETTVPLQQSEQFEFVVSDEHEKSEKNVLKSVVYDSNLFTQKSEEVPKDLEEILTTDVQQISTVESISSPELENITLPDSDEDLNKYKKSKKSKSKKTNKENTKKIVIKEQDEKLQKPIDIESLEIPVEEVPIESCDEFENKQLGEVLENVIFEEICPKDLPSPELIETAVFTSNVSAHKSRKHKKSNIPKIKQAQKEERPEKEVLAESTEIVESKELPSLDLKIASQIVDSVKLVGPELVDVSVSTSPRKSKIPKRVKKLPEQLPELEQLEELEFQQFVNTNRDEKPNIIEDLFALGTEEVEQMKVPPEFIECGIQAITNVTDADMQTEKISSSTSKSIEYDNKSQQTSEVPKTVDVELTDVDLDSLKSDQINSTDSQEPLTYSVTDEPLLIDRSVETDIKTGDLINLQNLKDLESQYHERLKTVSSELETTQIVISALKRGSEFNIQHLQDKVNQILQRNSECPKENLDPMDMFENVIGIAEASVVCLKEFCQNPLNIQVHEDIDVEVPIPIEKSLESMDPLSSTIADLQQLIQQVDDVVSSQFLNENINKESHLKDIYEKLTLCLENLTSIAQQGSIAGNELRILPQKSIFENEKYLEELFLVPGPKLPVEVTLIPTEKTTGTQFGDAQKDLEDRFGYISISWPKESTISAGQLDSVPVKADLVKIPEEIGHLEEESETSVLGDTFFGGDSSNSNAEEVLIDRTEKRTPSSQLNLNSVFPASTHTLNSIATSSVEKSPYPFCEVSALEQSEKLDSALKLWKLCDHSGGILLEWINRFTMGDQLADLDAGKAIDALKVCEENLEEHKKRIDELKELIRSIASSLGLDTNALLEGEILAMDQQLQEMVQSLTVLTDVVESRIKSNQDDKLSDSTSAYLSDGQEQIVPADQSTDKAKLVQLHQRLLTLGQGSPLIDVDHQNLKTGSDKSVLSVLELWQQIFRETFRQYHRLSTHLIRNEDNVAVLNLWQEYLTHVQHFLKDTTIPNDVHTLNEHADLCQIHKDLLTRQQSALKTDQSLMDHTVLKEYNTLSNLHNETLTAILQRHEECQKRLTIWRLYQEDHNRLLVWLNGVEKDREQIHLRYINSHQLPRIIERLKRIMSTVPDGEHLLMNIQQHHTDLFVFCDECLMASVRMEYAALNQRITNLQAGLRTWERFLDDSYAVLNDYRGRIEKLREYLNQTQTTLNQMKEEMNDTAMTHLNMIQTEFRRTLEDLEALRFNQQQLTECLSISDVKSINQEVWLIVNQYDDLEQQLNTFYHQLNEAQSAQNLFDEKYGKFVMWCEEMDTRIAQISTQDPYETLRLLESDLQGEILLKHRDYQWLTVSGANLLESNTDSSAKTIINGKLMLIDKLWRRLEDQCSKRRNTILEMIQNFNLLEQKIVELYDWMSEIEVELGQPVRFENLAPEVLEAKLKGHDQLRRSIETQSSNVGAILNLYNLLVTGDEALKMSFDTHLIRGNVETLEQRWKSICDQSLKRKVTITGTWKLLQECYRVVNQQLTWMNSLETSIVGLEQEPLRKQSREQVQAMIVSVEQMMDDVRGRIDIFEGLQQTYTKLQTSLLGLDRDNVKELTRSAGQILDKWYTLTTRLQTLLQNLQNEISIYNKFSLEYERVLVELTRIDAHLTQFQYGTTATSDDQQLLDIQRALEQLIPTLEKTDEIGVDLMNRIPENEQVAIQQQIDEYQTLWRDVKSRMISTEKPQQSSSVEEIDSVGPVLNRMPSICARDVYLDEILTAVRDCQRNVNDLTLMISRQLSKESNLDQFAKTISELFVTCQTNMNFIQHLYDSLVNEYSLSEDEFQGQQVEDLHSKIDVLETAIKQKNEEITQLSEHLKGPKRNLSQIDSDLWRFEKWLDNSEAQQSSQKTAPATKIETLQQQIQDFQEFHLKLESHRNILRTINSARPYLDEFTDDFDVEDQLRNRIASANQRWNVICEKATKWEKILRDSLLKNKGFHKMLKDLNSWSKSTEVTIRKLEPIDLTVDHDILTKKFQILFDLHNDLERKEAIAIRLKDSVSQLLVGGKSNANNLPDDEKGTKIVPQLQVQNICHKLHSLLLLTDAYLLKLNTVLKKDLKQHVAVQANGTTTATTDPTTVLQTNNELHRQRGHYPDNRMPSANGDGADHNKEVPLDECELEAVPSTSVLQKSYRFFGRVARASLPFHGILLLLLGLATLVPHSENDYTCSILNTLRNRMSTFLRYNNGPPPI